MINEIKNSAKRLAVHPTFSKGRNFNSAGVAVKEAKTGKTNCLPADAAQIRKFLTNYILTSETDYGLARLMPHLETVTLTSGKELHSSGECSRYVYFPETAVISNLYTLVDGSTIEVAMIGREGATDLSEIFGSQPSAHWSQVAIGGTALRIKTEILKQEFDRGGRIQSLLLDYVNSHIAQISQRVVCKSFHVIEKRLCSWFLMLHDRVRKNYLTLTQEQISLFLGVHRPSVTLVAQMLREKGLIDYTRGKVHILNRQKLETSACECYSVTQNNLLSSSAVN
jgi:CRP-like cAMP-binding protein